MFGTFLDMVLGVLYIVTWVLDLTALFKCSLTDPGIIPSIKSPHITQQKEICTK